MNLDSIKRRVPRAIAKPMRSLYRVPELDYWISRGAQAAGVSTTVSPTIYRPAGRRMPARVLAVESSWRGIESILAPLLGDFRLGRGHCLEFGVESGYSTVALSNFFSEVTGVDTFLGDKHAGTHCDMYPETSARLAPYANIRLVQSDFRKWIARDERTYDLIHIDIVHTYGATYDCGLWSARHAPCVIFHDTESFPAVRQAVGDIARKLGRRFYNFPECAGLGILA
jgi:hypothetical protein